LSEDASVGVFFEETLASAGRDADPKSVANWVVDDAVSRANEEGLSASRLTPQSLAALVQLVAGGTITTAAGRTVLDSLFAEGGDPAEIVEVQGLAKVGGGEELATAVDQAIKNEPEAAAKVRAGEQKALGPLMGVVMRLTDGRADGGEVRKLLLERLSG
jgi:aspartyl-tRNA(Asn)/glutamyl-tRNA(Gln) amidotransferase subunit B